MNRRRGRHRADAAKAPIAFAASARVGAYMNFAQRPLRPRTQRFGSLSSTFRHLVAPVALRHRLRPHVPHRHQKPSAPSPTATARSPGPAARSPSSPDSRPPAPPAPSSRPPSPRSSPACTDGRLPSGCLKWIPVHTYTIHTLGKGKFASMSSRTIAGVSRPHVAVIGGGFCELAAGYELGRRGVRATVLGRGAEVGGLATPRLPARIAVAAEARGAAGGASQDRLTRRMTGCVLRMRVGSLARWRRSGSRGSASWSRSVPLLGPGRRDPGQSGGLMTVAARWRSQSRRITTGKATRQPRRHSLPVWKRVESGRLSIVRRVAVGDCVGLLRFEVSAPATLFLVVAMH